MVKQRAGVRRKIRQLQEMIGRAANLTPRPPLQIGRGGGARVSVDRTQTDYAFWARLRRGQQKGYELGGLFAQPMAEIVTGWMLGEGVKVEMPSPPLAPPHLVERGIRQTAPPRQMERGPGGEDAINQFLARNRQLIWQWVYDSLTLGDAYLVVNPDGTLTPIPPDQVEIITDATDWRRVLAYRITTRMESATVVDEYRVDGRTVTIKNKNPIPSPTPPNTGRGSQNQSPPHRNREGNRNPHPLTPSPLSMEGEAWEYENLIGCLPVIHLANDREANEIYGHPVYEGLLKLFAEYDEVLRKSLDGVKIMGHPIPVIEGMDDPAETLAMNANDAERWLDASGNWQERPVVDFGRLSMMILGKGGQFKFASPGQFSGDAGRLLEYLFLLMLQHAKIPEWVWGGAIASSKASVDAQRPAFTMMIQARRARLEAALLELVRVWLATMELTSPPDPLSARSEGEWNIVWPEMVADDEAMTLRKVDFAYSQGIINQSEARGLLGL
ncbi:MAG: hypothetical protein BroJett018_50510 [Chloroflexota bacterium]|nr:MAG: hypothetical protein BroJett018_50510 [Chloroflexota bacterium]